MSDLPLEVTLFAETAHFVEDEVESEVHESVIKPFGEDPFCLL